MAYDATAKPPTWSVGLAYYPRGVSTNLGRVHSDNASVEVLIWVIVLLESPITFGTYKHALSDMHICILHD